MLTVYDRAIKRRPGRAIVEQTVRTATRELNAPGATPKPPAAAIDAPKPSEDTPEDVDDELPSEEISELVDRLDILRRHVDDLRLNVDDPILAQKAAQHR